MGPEVKYDHVCADLDKASGMLANLIGVVVWQSKVIEASYKAYSDLRVNLYHTRN